MQKKKGGGSDGVAHLREDCIVTLKKKGRVGGIQLYRLFLRHPRPRALQAD